MSTERRPAARIEIDAPLEVVWRVMLDTEGYAGWNPFVERAETSSPRPWATRSCCTALGERAQHAVAGLTPRLMC